MLSLTQQDGAVILTWTQVSGASYYKVKRGEAPAQLKDLSTNITATSFTDQTIDLTNTYYYAVSSVKNGKVSVNSNIVVCMAPPKVPTLFGVRESERVRLNWTKPSGADRYTLYRSTNSGGPYYAIVESFLLNQYTEYAGSARVNLLLCG